MLSQMERSMNSQVHSKANAGKRPFLFLAMVFATLIFGAVEAAAQSCRWDGTAPFCSGSCASGEQEITRLQTWPGFWTPVIVNPATNQFGSSCVTNQGAVLPYRRKLSLGWHGTFCSGGCRPGDSKVAPPPGSNSGASCWTGSKVYCCSRLGSSSEPLTIAPIIVSSAKKCLDVVAPDQHNNGARVQVWDCNNSLQQTWRLEGHAIKSGAGKCLDVDAPEQHNNGGKVQVWDCNNSQQQTWTIDGETIRSGAGKCLDVDAPDEHNHGAKVRYGTAITRRSRRRWRPKTPVPCFRRELARPLRVRAGSPISGAAFPTSLQSRIRSS